MATAFLGIVVLVGIAFVEVGATEVAEMRVAFETNHVVASMGLLGTGVACWAWLGVQLHVLLGSSFLGCELELGAWEADEIFAVPAFFADFAKCESTILADGETFRWWWQEIWVRRPIVILRLVACVLCIRFTRCRLLVRALRWSLTPLAWAVNCCRVRFETLLSFQFDIPLDHLLLQWNLK